MAAKVLEDDGLPVRPDVGPWTLDKLEIVSRYQGDFAKACARKAPGFYFGDGFAGPGVNRARDTGELAAGSPLLALETNPPFTSCLFMDSGLQVVRTLKERTVSYGQRAIVRRGNCNTDLVPAMEEHFHRRAPLLVLLDPEGYELSFSTVKAVSRFRNGKTKAEQLILLPTHTGFLRTLPTAGVPEKHNEDHMTRMYGTDRWEEIYHDRLRDNITTDTATSRYVNLYADQLRTLGYKTVLDREIREGGFKGALKYFLLFATDHEAGERIMDHIFNTVAKEREAQQLSLFKGPRRSRLGGE
jgi:three-Cys-motif partner protein